MEVNTHSFAFLILFLFLVHIQGISVLNPPKAMRVIHDQSWNYHVTIVVTVLHEPHVSCLKQGGMTGKLPGLELSVLVTLFLLGPHGPQWPLSTHCPPPPGATAGTERRPTINGEYQFQRQGWAGMISRRKTNRWVPREAERVPGS